MSSGNSAIIRRVVLSLFNNSFTYKNTSSSVRLIRRQCKYYSTCNFVNRKYNLDKRNINRSVHTTTSICSNNVVSFKLSDIGEGIREVIVKEWFVKEGDTVSQFDQICEVQSDKASVTITSRYDGVIRKLYYAIDDIALVGNPLVDIETSSSEELDENEVEDDVVTTVKKAENTFEINNNIEETLGVKNNGFAIPSVRRLAQENKIQLASIQGTGKDGRVLKEDVLKYINELTSSSTKQPQIENKTKIEPVRGYSKTMVKTMTEAMKIPHFVYHDELRVTNLIKLRNLVKKRSEEINVKITYLPFFIKATSNALSRYPIMNARLDDAAENIIYNESHNIGVAMDTTIGLVVPIIKNVQSKNILEISKELNRLQELGKQTKFSREDLSDGTFSFSNIGAIGGTYAKPIILPQQSAIIALGAFQNVPRFDNHGSVISESIAFLSGAADHRIIDGATMARFCNVLKQQIEEPYFLFLDI